MKQSPLLVRYRALPRAMRWALWALAIVVIYLTVLDPYVIGKAAQLHTKASETAASLEKLNKQAASSQWQDAVNSVTKFGEAALSDVDATGQGGDESHVAFNARITAVMQGHKIANYQKNNRLVAMGEGPLKRSINIASEQVDRVQAEIKFDASPETFAAVLADLEKAPEVSAISEVDVRRAERDASNRMLQVTIKAETWSITRKGGRGR